MFTEVIHKNDLLDQVFRAAVQHAERIRKVCTLYPNVFVSLCSFQLRRTKTISVRRVDSATEIRTGYLPDASQPRNESA